MAILTQSGGTPQHRQANPQPDDGENEDVRITALVTGSFKFE